MKQNTKKTTAKRYQYIKRWRQENREKVSEYNHRQYLRRKALREEGQRVREKGVEEGEQKDV